MHPGFGIRRLLKAQGVAVRELARRARVGASTISRAINLEAWPRKEQLERIASGLGVDVETLLMRDTDAGAATPSTLPLDGVVLPDGVVLSPSAASRSGLATPPRARALPEPELLPVSSPVDGFAVRLALEAPVQLGGDPGPVHDLRPGDVLILRWLERDELAPEGALVYATRSEEDGTVVAGELRLFFVARRIPRLAAIVGDDEVRVDHGWKVEAIAVEQRRRIAP